MILSSFGVSSRLGSGYAFPAGTRGNVSLQASYLDAHDVYCPSLVKLLLITKSKCCLVSPICTYNFYPLQFISNLQGFLSCCTALTCSCWHWKFCKEQSSFLSIPYFFFFFVSLFSLWTKAFLFSIINNSLSALMILLPKLCLRFGHWNPIQPASVSL